MGCPSYQVLGSSSFLLIFHHHSWSLTILIHHNSVSFIMSTIIIIVSMHNHVSPSSFVIVVIIGIHESSFRSTHHHHAHHAREAPLNIIHRGNGIIIHDASSCQCIISHVQSLITHHRSTPCTMKHAHVFMSYNCCMTCHRMS